MTPESPQSGLFDPASLVTALKAMAEPTRLRLLLLLRRHEWNVKDLTQILGQSQPRLSRHLKLLTEAGLIERFREGSWVYFHLSNQTEGGKLVHRVLELADKTTQEIKRDLARAQEIKRMREATAQQYFKANASKWEQLRGLHVSETKVEKAMRVALGPGPFDVLVDLGTGTGRALELFHDVYQYGIGIDINQAMLAYARANMDKSALDNVQIRHGDLYSLTLHNNSADAVIMHQVLHYLSDPPRALSEAKRILKPAGKLLIVDFAPHELEFLREDHAHERLGISDKLMTQWLRRAGLRLVQRKDLDPPAVGDDKKLTVTLWLVRHDHKKHVSEQKTLTHAGTLEEAP